VLKGKTSTYLKRDSAQTPEKKSFLAILSDSVKAVSASASVSVKVETVPMCQCKSRDIASVIVSVRARDSVSVIVRVRAETVLV
jgi:hypothetical protein